MEQTPPFAIKVEEADPTSSVNIFVISFSGSEEVYLDSANFPKLSDQLIELLADQKVHIIIDLAKVVFISNVGLMMIIENLEELRAEQGDIQLINMSDKVYAFFDLIGASRRIQIHPDLETAITSFKSELKLATVSSNPEDEY